MFIDPLAVPGDVGAKRTYQLQIWPALSVKGAAGQVGNAPPEPLNVENGPESDTRLIVTDDCPVLLATTIGVCDAFRTKLPPVGVI